MSKDSFASLMESGTAGADDRARRRLHAGDAIDVVVIQAGAEYVYVDAGTPSDGRIPREELADEHGKLRVGPGDRIRAVVVEARSDGPLLKALGQTAPRGAAAGEAPRPDEVLRAKVTRVEKFGVFVSTPKGDGLVPIRELGLPPGADHRRLFPTGKELDVVVIDVGDGGKIRFSATQVARVEEANNFREFAQGQKSEGDASATAEAGRAGFGNLGDVLRTKLGLTAAPEGAAPGTAAAAAKPGTGGGAKEPEGKRGPDRGRRRVR